MCMVVVNKVTAIIAFALGGIAIVMAAIDGFRELKSRRKNKQNTLKNKQCRKRGKYDGIF